MTISDKQLCALHNLADKQAGGDVDWISIADARALTELGLAKRTLAVMAAVLGDPKVQGLVSEIHAANLRAHGALVLAPTPIR